VKTERLDWLANNPFYTKRFAFYVGQRCRDSTVKAIAGELHLDWQTVKELDKQYMAEQLRLAGPPAPTVIGIDEIAIGKGHSYRIVVSDLLLGTEQKNRADFEREGRATWASPRGWERMARTGSATQHAGQSAE
jgi:hypothetical protein